MRNNAIEAFCVSCSSRRALSLAIKAPQPQAPDKISWSRPNRVTSSYPISLGGSAWEGTSELLGETFFYSGHEQSESVRLLREAGFEVLHSAIDDPSSRGHLAVLARKGEVGHA